MFCNKCGKEIPNQAQFCNYCGSPVNNIQSQPNPAQQPAQKPVKAKKGSQIGAWLIRIAVPVVVFLVVSFVVEELLSPKPQNPSYPSSSSSSDSFIEVTVPSLTDACIYGGIYENGSFTYGLTRLYLYGYSLLPGTMDGEPDALLSPDENFTLICDKAMEIIDVSYEASNREGIISSFGEGVTVILMDYQKYYVGDYPVIRYIARTDLFGEERYVGELIVFPSVLSKETIRLQMVGAPGAGYDEITRVFDTLSVVPEEYAPSAENSTAVGYDRITVK